MLPLVLRVLLLLLLSDRITAFLVSPPVVRTIPRFADSKGMKSKEESTSTRLHLLPAVACLGVATIASIAYVRRKRNQRNDDDEVVITDNATVTPKQLKSGRSTLSEEMDLAGGSLAIQPVGVIRSIYRLCVGTPRQGLLAPHARGRIELTLPFHAAKDSVCGLEEFSHIWIVFVFHLNTVGKTGRVPSKISPPALGGRKVGVFASRAPHRFNPVGITLAKLDGVRVVQKHVQGRKPVQTVCLDISGLDLVDGTPVVDIKPYVPDYDAPIDGYNLPNWVSGGLATKRNVCISDSAKQEVRLILEQDKPALEFYGGPKESTDQAIESVIACIQEVLAMDVRSQWQTKKARQGKSQAERATRVQQVLSSDVEPATSAVCTQQIDNLLIHYTVSEAASIERSTSEGSGAEDGVTVTSIQLIR